MTPMSEIALDMGCVWTTTFTAHTTAAMANTRNRIRSMEKLVSLQRHHKAGDQQIRQGDRK